MVDRVTHAYEGPLALFLIGLRVHKPWRVGIVGAPVSAHAADDRRARGQQAAADRGEAESPGLPRQPLDRSHLGPAPRHPVVAQRRRHLRLRQRATLEHRPAWLDFYRARQGRPDSRDDLARDVRRAAGRRRERLRRAGPFGLAAIAGTVPVGRRGETARERLGRPGRPTARRRLTARTCGAARSGGGAQRRRPGAHPGVDLGVARRGVHEPGVGEVGRASASGSPT